MDEELLDFTIEDDEEGGSEIVDFFLRWLPLIIPLAAIGAVFAFLYYRTLPSEYRAVTTVLAEVHTQSVLKEVREKDPNALNYSTRNTREFFATQMQVLRSRDLAERVQNRLKLVDNPKWRQGLELPPNANPSKVMESTLGRLRGGFGIERERYARVIRLSFEHTDPLLTTEIVHAFAEEYVGKSSSQRTTSQKRAQMWLQTEERRLRKELANVEAEIDAHKRSEGLLSADTKNSRTLRWASLSRLQQEADRLKILSSRLSEELAALDSMDIEGKAATLIKVHAKSTPVFSIHNDLVAAQADLAKQRARYNDEHPIIQETKKRIGALLGGRDKIINATVLAQRAELDSVRKQRARVLGALQSGRGEVLNINALEQVHNRLVHRQTNIQKMLSSVADQLLTTGMAVRLDTNNVQILDHASVPIAPVGPNGKLITAVGFIMGLVLAALIGLFTELAQTTLQGPDQVRRLGNVPLIGVVDNLSKPIDMPDLAVANQPRSNLAEQFRSIRSNLLFMRVDEPPRSVSITSPSPKDGKTFNAVSLAVVMAQSGKRVLIIDTDLRRGRLHRVFDRENEVGVIDLMMKKATVDECCQDTEIENLELLSTGAHPPNPAELLHSEAFKAMRDRLLEEFDLLVFDTPPVNLVTDAVILANCTDGMILVVREGQTAKRDLAMCLERLSSGRAKLMGFIYNGQRHRGGGYGYGYRGYGYRRYGYYGRYRSYSPYYGYQSYGIEES